MGACETTPTTPHAPGNQPATSAQDNPIHKEATQPDGSDQVTGSIQHCLLSTKAPMGAGV